MNKTALCIRLLQILNSKMLFSKNQLAELLETNPRNITEYIQELQLAGYDIQSKKGIKGGYYLNESGLLPSTPLSVDEVRALKYSCSYLEKQADFLEDKPYFSAMGKILSASRDDEMPFLTVIDRYPLAIEKSELINRYTTLKKALSEKKKCRVWYLSSKNQPKTYLLHPYKVFIYSNAWFLLAWNEAVNRFGYYKINRIQKIEILNESYTFLKTYKESDYLDAYGMRQNGAYYSVRLLFTDLSTVLSERIYGKNQLVTPLDEHHSILECMMQNKKMIVSFVLSFGDQVQVLEPQWLKEEILRSAETIIKKYQ
ncbi:MAG TPA: WYL domain-containing protein [Candidatus Pelethenecus faecipullorum]|uniref:WYL domain-containing protein n=1 Tax=Candidatus Pelethenecus faecipullorum TaxID=2840900 RepID=A0A9D1KJ12_9MOLU|nr:WYL domain-containing protein [Candidatus Pelethenecus faecipullorum]